MIMVNKSLDVSNINEHLNSLSPDTFQALPFWSVYILLGIFTLFFICIVIAQGATNNNKYDYIPTNNDLGLEINDNNLIISIKDTELVDSIKEVSTYTTFFKTKDMNISLDMNKFKRFEHIKLNIISRYNNVFVKKEYALTISSETKHLILWDHNKLYHMEYTFDELTKHSEGKTSDNPVNPDDESMLESSDTYKNIQDQPRECTK